MKERPILFSAPMVRATLDGRKTQTRRVVKLVGTYDAESFFTQNERGGIMLWTPAHEKVFASREAFADWTRKTYPDFQWNYCPYGQPGDRLWVRETFCPIYPQDPHYNGGQPIEYDYAATYQHGDRLGDHIGERKVWERSTHMPRAASRITLEITAVRVERLQDISEADAMAEGVRQFYGHQSEIRRPYTNGFRFLWLSLHGGESWNKNPYVWVLEFKRV